MMWQDSGLKILSPGNVRFDGLAESHAHACVLVDPGARRDYTRLSVFTHRSNSLMAEEASQEYLTASESPSPTQLHLQTYNCP